MLKIAGSVERVRIRGGGNLLKLVRQHLMNVNTMSHNRSRVERMQRLMVSSTLLRTIVTSKLDDYQIIPGNYL